jgi:hypothetical protein
MEPRSKLAALLSVAVILGCARYTKAVAESVELSTAPLVFEREFPWSFEASTLDL